MPERSRAAVRRRHLARRGVPLAVALVVMASLATLTIATVGHAQTTPTTTAPPTTTTTAAPTTTTTAPSTTTTAPSTATTAAGTTATTASPGTGSGNESSDDGLPWVPIVVGVAILALVIVAAALLARRRGARRQELVDWRHHAADTIAEAGAAARLLSTGTPPSGQIAQQLVASLRSFEELADTAHDDETAEDIEHGRRSLQMLGLAIDSDYRLRRQASPDRAQLTQSQDAVRNAAAEADRTLRGIYRGLTAS